MARSYVIIGQLLGSCNLLVQKYSGEKLWGGWGWEVLHRAVLLRVPGKSRASALPLSEASNICSKGGRWATHNICTTAGSPACFHSPEGSSFVPHPSFSTCQNCIWKSQGAAERCQGEKKYVSVDHFYSLRRESERDALTAAVSDSLQPFSFPALQDKTSTPRHRSCTCQEKK